MIVLGKKIKLRKEMEIVVLREVIREDLSENVTLRQMPK